MNLGSLPGKSTKRACPANVHFILLLYCFAERRPSFLRNAVRRDKDECGEYPSGIERTRRTKQIIERTEPAFIEPMQCKPVTALPTDEKWTFEIKFDGYRCIAVKRGRDLTLFSRYQKALNKRFQKVVDALASLGSDFVFDGELVAFDSQGRPSFQVLQNNPSRGLPVYFYAFDLLNRDGNSC
jgi:ATP-dependent DNA ligase